MESEGSSPCSQQPATCPYPEPNESNPHPQTLRTGQQILRWLWNPKVHYRVHDRLPMNRILMQLNSVQNYSLNIHINIILLSTPRYHKWSLLFKLTNWDFVNISHLPHACYIHFRSLSLRNNLSQSEAVCVRLLMVFIFLRLEAVRP
jgi:hypothetical protein